LTKPIRLFIYGITKNESISYNNKTEKEFENAVPVKQCLQIN